MKTLCSAASWRRPAALLLVLLGFTAMAAEPGVDHPLLPRYPGAVLQGHDLQSFEEAALLLSRPRSAAGGWQVDRTLPVEGRVTYLHYEAPAGVSALQVFRNYRDGFVQSGFEMLNVCERPCLEGNLGWMKGPMKARNLYLNGHENNQYLAARRGADHVSMWVNEMSQRTHVWAFVIEGQPMRTGLIQVQGHSPLARGLAEKGRFDAYGFLFDSGQSVLRPDSAPALQELAIVLRENPALDVELIGHTDDVGQPDANQRLSEARARAVAATLIAQHGVAPARLHAGGRGASQPVDPAQHELARAKNRRVEVVARMPVAAAPSSPLAAPPGAPALPARRVGDGSPQAGARQDGVQPPAPPEQAAQGEKPSGTPTASEAVRAVNEAANTLRNLKGLFGR